mmetsp:Transcript_11245/g.20549  ORF Transcript_11245/g.20549 Transcript_11245/m.20549 type:complete len:445 (-) Transcript_11245:131-1465(-)
MATPPLPQGSADALDVKSLQEENARLRQELQALRAGSQSLQSSGILDARDVASRSRYNCVSQSSQVWREGASGPISIEQVQAGDRILAADLASSQSPSIEFVPVQEISKVREKPEARWLRISLSDGSQAVVTASHPVFPERQLMSGQMDTSPSPVKAEELQVGIDRLVVMKLEAVSVSEVTPLEDDQNGAAEQFRLRLGREASESDSGVQGKPSRPSLLLASPSTNKASSLLSLIALGDRSSKPRLPDPTSGSAVSESSESDVDADILSGDEADDYSALDEELEIILGGTDQRSSWSFIRQGSSAREWRRCEDRQPAICLSEIRALPKDTTGTKLSFGSLGHALHNDACKVCVFNRKTGVACRHSWLCNFCHAKHQPYVRPSRRNRQTTLAAPAGDPSRPCPMVGGHQPPFSGFADPRQALSRPVQEPAYVNPAMDIRQCKVSI